MEKILTIKYDVLTRDLKIDANDFTTFEAFGVLEAAKAMIADGWIRYTNEKEV